MMNKQSYKEAWGLADGASGPLAPYIKLFTSNLVSQGYAGRSVYVKVYRAADFDNWLKQKQVSLPTVNEQQVVSYHRDRCEGSPRPWYNELGALRVLLAFLRAHGAIDPLPKTSGYPAVDIVVEGFAYHLLNARGLTLGTIGYYVDYVRGFLIDRFSNTRIQLGAITAIDIVGYLQHLAARNSPNTLRLAITALRSFARYARYLGEVGPELASAIPAIAHWSTTAPLPRAISSEHAQRVLDCCNGKGARELRDKAILLLLARLGFRSGDIVSMMLNDVDWDHSCLRVTGKGRRECFVPMPYDVGEAIAQYLHHARPCCADRHLFVRLRAPFHGLGRSDAVGSVVRNALARAGINAPHEGAHQFRHALAVRMIQQGASLAEIGELLRHRSPQATAIYARIDIDALRGLVMPWPGESV